MNNSLVIRRGFESPYFSYTGEKAVLENCAVVILGDVIQEHELTDLIEEYRIPKPTTVEVQDQLNRKYSVLLFVESISDTALARLVSESRSGRLCICVVSLPFGPELTNLKQHEIGEFCFGNKINAMIYKNRTILEIDNAITIRTNTDAQIS